MKAFVPGRNALEPVPSGSAQRDLAHSDPVHRVLVRHVPGHHVLVRRSSAPAVRRHGRRTIAPPVRQLSLGNARRAPNRVRHSLDQHLRVKVGRLVDLPGVAVLMAVARSRRSHGRSPIPIVQLVQAVQHSNPTLLARVAKLPLLVKKSRHPDRPDCRLKQSSQNANLQSAPVQAAPRPAAPQRAVRRFVVLVLTGQALVVLAKAVPASSGRERTGHVQMQGQIAHDPIEQDRTGRRRTASVLIAPPSTAPAMHAQPAAPAAPALVSSAQVVPLVPKATARAPSPPAPANPAPAALDPATNAPDRPRQGSPRGSPNLAVPADRLPEAAQNRPLVPAAADFQSPVLASKAKPAVVGSRLQADPGDQGPAANALAASPEEKSEADKSGIRPGCHTRASRARLSAGSIQSHSSAPIFAAARKPAWPTPLVVTS